jgi:hypothetical protein
MITNNSKLKVHEVHISAYKKAIVVMKGVLKQSRDVFQDYFRRYHRRRSINSPSRKFVEDSLLPSMSKLPRGTKVLFVGTRWYTSHYDKYFEDSGINFITCEIDPAASVYGSAMGHIKADFLTINNFVGSKTFDILAILGVFGFGINDEERFLQAIKICFELLKDNGKLIVGWNLHRTIEPNEKNVKIIQQYFHPVKEFQGLPFHISFINQNEFHIFEKNS